MRALLQRVSRAAVAVEGEVVGAIAGPGLLVLLGVTHADTTAEASWLARKVLELRLFADDEGKTNRSLVDVGGGVLVVSQFTLYADARKGRRPGFSEAAPPEVAVPLYEAFVAELAATGLPVATGRFGAHMAIDAQLDGPVTLWLDRPPGDPSTGS